MSKSSMEFVDAELEPDATEARRDGQLEASVLTSADTKLAYNEDKERFETIIVGDINAFPEGLMKQSELHGRDITGEVAKGLTQEFQGDVVVNLPEYAFQGDDGLVTADELPSPDEDEFGEELREMGLEDEWLIDEKLNLAKGTEYGDPELSGIPDVEGVENVHLTYGGRGLESDGNGKLLYEGESVEGCVNLSDRGENLLNRVNSPDALSRIVNAPTAVWNSDLEETQKVSLMKKAGEAQEDFENVQTADAQRIEDEDEVYEKVREKFDQEESLVVKTDPMGTWGDGLIVFDYDEFKTAQDLGYIFRDEIQQELLEGETHREELNQYIGWMIRNESARVSNNSNRDNDIELIGDNGFYSRGDTNYAVAEQAIEGRTKLGGDTYHVIETEDGEPIDFVPLLVSNGEPEVASYFARVSKGDDNLNANRGSDKFDVESLENFYKDNKELFEEAAESETSLQEVEAALDQAGKVAYLARNRTAYEAERSL